VSGSGAVRESLVAGASPKGDAELYGAGILSASASAFRVFWMHFGLRALALLVLGAFVVHRIRKRGGKLGAWGGAAFGAALGAVGLVPILPLLGLGARFGDYRWIAELAMRPFGEWDVVFDASLHRWLPLANALPVLVATALFFGVRRFRSTLGGFALGSGALLSQMALLGDVATPFGAVATKLWLIVNVAVCLWVARVGLDRKRT
jgi:serine protease